MASASLKDARPRQQQAADWIVTAEDYMNAGDWLAAEQLLDRAIAAQHDLVAAYLLRARVREQQRDLEGAITDYTAAVHLQPDRYEARFQRAMVLYDAQRYPEARADLRFLLANPPTQTNAVFYYGQGNEGSLQTSGITTIQSNLRVKWLNTLGLTYYHQEDYANARKFFGLAIAEDSTYAESYVNLGLTAENQFDTTRAIANYKNALHHAPDNATAMRNLGSIARRQNNQALLNQIVSHYGADGYESALQAGLTFLEQNDYPAAIASFTQALSWEPDNAEAYLQRGFAYEKAELFAQALADYTKVIEDDPTAEKAYSNRGNVRAKLEDHNQAISDYTQALVVNPKNARVLYNRAIAYHHLGEPDRACQDWQEALELGNPDAKRPLSSLCQP